MTSIKLHGIYINANGQRLQPYHLDTKAGQINTRIHAHNFTTGYDESWTARLFLSEHVTESKAAGK